MNQPMHKNSGVRLTTDQWTKLDALAKSLHTSRNRVFGILLEAADITPPVTNVKLQKNSGSGVTTTQTAVSSVR